MLGLVLICLIFVLYHHLSVWHCGSNAEKIIDIYIFFFEFLVGLQVVGVGEEWSHIPFVGIIICLVTNSFSIALLQIIDTRSHTWHYNNKKTTYYYYFKQEGISYLISNTLNFYLRFKIYPKYLIFIDS